MANAKRDGNHVPSLIAVSSSDGVTPVILYADPTTHRLLIDNANSQASLVVGTTTITGGTNTYIEYNNNGVLGEYGVIGNTTNVPLTSGLSASEIVATDSSENLVSLSTATYPSLTELSYVKGVSSAIQTQINSKGVGTVTAVSIATANGFSGSSSGGATPALTIVAGTITPTSVNGLTISTTTGTFTLSNGKTLTVSDSTTLATGAITLGNGKVLTVSDSSTLATNAITLGGGEVITFSASNALSLLTSGTTVMTFPQATDTVAVLGTAQTYTATMTEKQVIYSNNAITASSSAATVPITYRLNTVTNDAAATLTITMTTTSAVDGQMSIVRILDHSAVAQTISWTNTENSGVSAPTTSNGSTTLFLTVGFIFNGGTSKWRCLAVA